MRPAKKEMMTSSRRGEQLFPRKSKRGKKKSKKRVKMIQEEKRTNELEEGGVSSGPESIIDTFNLTLDSEVEQEWIEKEDDPKPRRGGE